MKNKKEKKALVKMISKAYPFFQKEGFFNRAYLGGYHRPLSFGKWWECYRIVPLSKPGFSKKNKPDIRNFRLHFGLNLLLRSVFYSDIHCIYIERQSSHLIIIFNHISNNYIIRYQTDNKGHNEIINKISEGLRSKRKVFFKEFNYHLNLKHFLRDNKIKCEFISLEPYKGKTSHYKGIVI